VTLLVSLGGDDKPPTVTATGGDAASALLKLSIAWPDGRTEKVAIDLKAAAGDADPVRWAD
jgi:hypothetical protein